MFCVKCGTNNEDTSTFCKNCGAKLVKPATTGAGSSGTGSQSISGNSGVVQAAKPVNIILIAGLAVAAIVVVMVVGGLVNANKTNNKAETVNNEVAEVEKPDNMIVNKDINIAENTSVTENGNIVDVRLEEVYSVTADKLGSDIAAFARLIANGMYSVSDKFYFEKKMTLEDIMVMTSTKKINAGIFAIYDSNPNIIVSDEAEMKNVDQFVALCGESYKKIQTDIRENEKSVTESYIDVKVIDSNINGEYKYYDGKAEKIYIGLKLYNEIMGNEYFMFEMIQSHGKPNVWLINDCWKTSYDDIRNSGNADYNLLSVKLVNGDGSKSEVSYNYLDLYWNYINENNLNYHALGSNYAEYAFVDASVSKANQNPDPDPDCIVIGNLQSSFVYDVDEDFSTGIWYFESEDDKNAYLHPEVVFDERALWLLRLVDHKVQIYELGAEALKDFRGIKWGTNDPNSIRSYENGNYNQFLIPEIDFEVVYSEGHYYITINVQGNVFFNEENVGQDALIQTYANRYFSDSTDIVRYLTDDFYSKLSENKKCFNWEINYYLDYDINNVEPDLVDFHNEISVKLSKDTLFYAFDDQMIAFGGAETGNGSGDSYKEFMNSFGGNNKSEYTTYYKIDEANERFMDLN